MKKIIEYFKLKKRYNALMADLQKRMVDVKETMELNDVTNVYAEYVCKMHNWTKYVNDYYLTAQFCEVSLSFMNGYIKALHDNGLEFQNGMVRKRHITEDMPIGALEHYRNDAIIKTKAKAAEALRKVLGKYEASKANINMIVSAFMKEIEED